jgi:1,4-dihydroxy-2-naphthoyl-CoA hydrolase
VPADIQAFIEAGRGRLPGLLGVEIDAIEDGHVRMRLPLRPELLAPNGYLHAGTVVALADSACGYGCIASLPEGATGFTTIELKTNFLATALDGTLHAASRRVHGGRTTQVWDATVSDQDGKTLALFRCTQLLLYPR